MDFRDSKLYACGAEGGEVAGLVRLEATSTGPPGQLITWVNPGGRQRAYEIAKVLANDADRFAFEDERGRRFELRELTVSAYNDRIRVELDPSNPRVESEAALLAAFRASLAHI